MITYTVPRFQWLPRWFMRWPWARLTITRVSGTCWVRVCTVTLTPAELQAEIDHALTNLPITADKSNEAVPWTCVCGQVNNAFHFGCVACKRKYTPADKSDEG